MANVYITQNLKDKLDAFKKCLKLCDFEKHLTDKYKKSGKNKKTFSVIIKANLMPMVNRTHMPWVITDKEMVTSLVEFIKELGFTNIKIVESDMAVQQMMKSHCVENMAKITGYDQAGAPVVNLTKEKIMHDYYLYEDDKYIYKWKHPIGKSVLNADFLISFAKGKTHQSDWFTLCIKNMYGCMPEMNKSYWYHEYSEVWLVTAALLCEKPVDYSFIDAWLCSDGPMGHVGVSIEDKDIEHMGHCAKKIGMVFASRDIVAIDMEFARRAEQDYRKMKIMKQYIKWAMDGIYPKYDIVSKLDKHLMFSDIVNWENPPDSFVEDNDWTFEENTVLFVLRLPSPAKFIDTNLFPYTTFIHRIGANILKFILYKIMNPIRIALGLKYL
jgi:uncharacterized protein (DUF362 family)